MNANTHLLRPRLNSLVFHLYGRPLHPELFETLAERTVRQNDFSLTVRVTRTGHSFTWSRQGVFLTEVAAAADEPLPTARRLLHHRLHGEHNGAWGPRGGITYQVSSQVETLPPEQFVHVHEDLLADGAKRR